MNRKLGMELSVSGRRQVLEEINVEVAIVDWVRNIIESIGDFSNVNRWDSIEIR